MKTRKLNPGLVIFLLGMVLANAAVLWQLRASVAQGYGDFANLYAAGKLVREGHAEQLYDRRWQWRTQQEFASSVKIRNGPLLYVRPPFEALLFAPLSYLSYPTACVVWLATNILILLGIPFLMPFPPEWPSGLLQGVLCLGFFPLGLGLLQGQDSVLLLLIFVLSLSLLWRGRDFLCGGCLALGLFKFHMVIPVVLVFLLRGKFKVVLGWLSGALLLGAISLWMMGPAAALGYPKYLWELNRTAFASPELMPSLRGLVASFNSGHDFKGVAGVVGIAEAAGIFFSAYLWSRGRDDQNGGVAAGFSLAMAVTLLTSYYIYSNDMTLLLLPVLLFSGGFAQGQTKWPQRFFVFAVVLLFFNPLFWGALFRFGGFSRLAFTAILLFVMSLSGMLSTRLPGGGSAEGGVAE